MTSGVPGLPRASQVPGCRGSQATVWVEIRGNVPGRSGFNTMPGGREGEKNGPKRVAHPAQQGHAGPLGGCFRVRGAPPVGKAGAGGARR